MKKGVVTGVSILAIVVILIGIINASRTRELFVVNHTEDGLILVTAKKSGREASGAEYLTLEDGQEISVQASLTSDSTIVVEILSADRTVILLTESFTADDFRSFQMPAGDYLVRVSTHDGAAGTMTIAAQPPALAEPSDTLSTAASIV